MTSGCSTRKYLGKWIFLILLGVPCLLAFHGKRDQTDTLRLISFTPTSHSADVALDATIVLSFNREVDMASAQTENIVVMSEQTGLLRGELMGAGSNTLTFVPSQNFRAGDKISVSVLAKMGLRSGFVFSFHTKAAVKEVDFVKRILPAEGRFFCCSGIADLDGDGDLDLIASQFDPELLWLWNDGQHDPDFTDHVTIPRSGVSKIVAGDMNGDQYMDLVVATGRGYDNDDQDDAQLFIYTNDGAATPAFSEKRITRRRYTVQDMAIGDLDGDGDQDILVVTHVPYRGGEILWYRNDGGDTPTFKKTTILGSFPWISHLAIGDMDGDGDLDFITAKDRISSILLFENNGRSEPTFTSREILTRGIVQDLALADLDQDQDLDAVVAYGPSVSGSPTGVRWFENEEASFSMHTLDAQINATLVKTADLNGDGASDIISYSSTTLRYHENSGSSEPAFETKVIERNVVRATEFAFGDIDGDSDLDIYSAEEDVVAWYENRTPLEIRSFALDGQLEEAVINPTDQSVSIRVGPDLDRSAITPRFTLSEGASSEPAMGSTIDFSKPVTFRVFSEEENSEKEWMVTVALSGTNTLLSAFPLSNTEDASVDTDIRLSFEKVISENELESGSIKFRGENSGEIPGTYSGAGTTDITFTPSNRLKAGEKFTVYMTGQLLGDAYSFRFRTGTNPSETITYDRNLLRADFHMRSVYDMDQDGDLDIIGQNGQKYSLLENDGYPDPTFTETVIADNSRLGGYSAVGDLDGNGHPDLAISRTDNGVFWYANDGVQFTRRLVSGDPMRFSQLAIEDLDRDGDLDIAATSASGYFWFENDGSAIPRFRKIVLMYTSGGYFSVDDVDGDGDQDLIHRTHQDGIFWFDQQAAVDPTFTRRWLAGVAIPVGLQMADIDGDHDLDLISSSFYDYRIYWAENRGTTSFSQIQPIWSARSFKFAKVGDIDGDGDLDVLAASDREDNYNVLDWYLNDGAREPSFSPFNTDVVVDDDFSVLDINGDGRLDILSSESEGIVFYRNGPEAVIHSHALVICEGESLAFGSRTLTSAGEYWEYFTTQSGRDSTVVLTLTVEDEALCAVLTADKNERQELSVYPNPVSEQMQLDFQSTFSGSISVSTLDGSVALRFKIAEQSSVAIDTSKWPKGIYIIHCRTERGTEVASAKVIRQ